jgi:hypothetical protein
MLGVPKGDEAVGPGFSPACAALKGGSTVTYGNGNPKTRFRPGRGSNIRPLRGRKTFRLIVMIRR